MSKLYASVISSDKVALVAVARAFSHTIEVTEDGVLFDVSGLERLIGKPARIAEKIVRALEQNGVSGSVAVAETVETATLLSRQDGGQNHTAHSPNGFQRLPLSDLDIEQDTLNVLSDLGLRHIEDVLAIPHDGLIARYGQGFKAIIDALEQKGTQLLTPNVKETQISWKFDLDNAVEDFEQLIFIVNHGLDHLFRRVSHFGHSTEHLDISFDLCRSPHVSNPHVSKGHDTYESTRISADNAKTYEIKTSFPTLDKQFWLKLINLRISLDPPEAAIRSVKVVSHFTKPRSNQRGLYAVSRPEPESLLLTVGKLKKLVGVENVGVPVLLDQRLAESFKLDADKLPDVRAEDGAKPQTPKSGIIAFTYFRPSVPAEVLVRDGRLVFLKTRVFSGHVLECSGVWRMNSKWWDKPWRTLEWDVEIEGHGIYRLCKGGEDWFVIGEYD